MNIKSTGACLPAFHYASKTRHGYSLHPRCLRFSLAVAAALCAGSASAAVHSWTGEGGANTNWSNSANWGSVGVPDNGDTVVFPAGAAGLTNYNDLSGLTLNQIIFAGAGGGYDLRGSNLTVTNAVMATNTVGANAIGCAIGFSTATNIQFSVSAQARLSLYGPLTGPGGLTKTDAGTLALEGADANTFAGSTIVAAGTLFLNKTNTFAIGIGKLIVGTGTNSTVNAWARSLGSDQINNSSVVVNADGVLDLNGFDVSVGPELTLNGGVIQNSSPGTLRLMNNSILTANRNSTIEGYFNVGSTNTVCQWMVNDYLVLSGRVVGAARLVKKGVGNVALTASNSFFGPLIIQQGMVLAENDHALGATNGGILVTNDASLVLENVAVTNKTLTLAGPGKAQTRGTLDVESGISRWVGPVIVAGGSTLNSWNADAELHIAGPIKGTGGVEVFGGGTHYFEGPTANTYIGVTAVDPGSTLCLNKSTGFYSTSTNVIISGVLQLIKGEQIPWVADMQINNGGVFDLNGCGQDINTLHGSGNVTLGLDGALYVGWAGGSSEFDGLISGEGRIDGNSFIKYGNGTFHLTTSNTYQNRNLVYGGTLILDGQQPQNLTVVNAGATLAGTGAVGVLTNFGTLMPGNSLGTFTSSNLLLTPGGSVSVQLHGPVAGAQYDQLNVNGTVFLAGTLDVQPLFLTPVAPGQEFVIINNDDSEPVVGTFSGLPEGSVINTNGWPFRLSYAGGTGNDVTLTLLRMPMAAVAASVNADTGSHNFHANSCNNFSLVISNQSGANISGIDAVLSTTTEGVVISQPYSSYPNLMAGCTATNLTPFQISVGSALPRSISLQLTVMSSIGTLTMNYLVTVGNDLATPLRFDVIGDMTMPDVGAIDSTNIVNGYLAEPLRKVAISLYITHPNDGELTNISLVAPDGTTVLLSYGFRPSQDFGAALFPDTSRTTFDDDAAKSITAGDPPFTGTFKPQSPLGVLAGVVPQGAWHLHIGDGCLSYTGIGTLHGWSLFLYGTDYSPGSGVCDFCMPATTNAVTAAAPVQAGQCVTNQIPASYGSPKVWPGTTAGSFHYNVHTFTNTSPADAAVTVELQAAGRLQATAYLNSFDPLLISSNYLGDAGCSTDGGITTFSCRVPAGAPFLVVVSEATADAGTQNYQLQLAGLPCPPPELNIAPAGPGQNRISWHTSAGGYVLERSTNLVSDLWNTVTNAPIVTAGQYTVTNSATGASDRFYRLHKR